jgi:UDP-glucose-4-epimerase GalE
MTTVVLVTGGAGYIGSHTCLALERAGYAPVTFDNLHRGHRSAVRWGPLVVGDLADKTAIRHAIRTFNIDAVLHFAAFAYVGESVENPSLYFQNNVANTLNLLDVMRETGVRHLVFSSTCAVYGVPDSMPITETTPTVPINPYGESKLQVERMLAWFQRAYSFKWSALRYFNAAGAEPGALIGESHDPESHLIPLAIQAALGLGRDLKIFGTDYPTPDGTAVRDYIHVSDLANAHVRALEYLRGGGISEVFNLGTGRGLSVREVVEEVRRATARSVPCTETQRRQGDPPQLVADAAKAMRVLGWQPTHSDLKTLVSTALEWEQRRRLMQVA